MNGRRRRVCVRRAPSVDCQYDRVSWHNCADARPCHRYCARGLLGRRARHRAGGIVASECLPMVRGHAEALMPLIARVMDAPGIDFARSRPHRGHHRTRQLHRLARRHRRRARHRARRRQTGGRPVDAARLCRAALAADDTRRWSPRSMRATTTSICSFRARRPHRRSRRGLRRCARRCAPRPTRRRASSAPRRNLCRGLAASGAPPLVVDARGAPDIDWVARPAPPRRQPGAAQAALPARARRAAAERRQLARR